MSKGDDLESAFLDFYPGDEDISLEFADYFSDFLEESLSVASRMTAILEQGREKKDYETMWEDQWLAIRQLKGEHSYTYSHENKCDGIGVAVLVYKTDPFLIAGRYENCPPHRDGIALCALTGQYDNDSESLEECAAREVLEESGIKCEAQELQSLGTIRPSKSSDTTIHMFALDAKDRELGEATGDGTKGEEGAYCHWVTVDEAATCKDPIMASLIARLAFKPVED